MTNDQSPRPGSREARRQGCTCPVMDNDDRHGLGISVMVEGCPVHHRRARTQDGQKDRS